MWRDFWGYLRALWKHWVVLVSGVGSVIVGAVGAYLRTSLPYWTFWVLALVCFFVASFRAWRDVSIALQSAQSEINQLRTPKYAKEQLELVRGFYGRLDEHEKALLKELRLRGSMLEPQATEFRSKRTGQRTIGLLHAMQYKTNLVVQLIGDQYQVNPDMKAALDAVFDEDER
jgi:hypothetical protein